MSTATQRHGGRDQIALALTDASTHERFWSKVEPAPAESCWNWTASLNSGYGQFFIAKIAGQTNLVRAHRWAYLVLRSDEIEGLVLDHLCRNRACVNPWHLEPVTEAVNIQRGVSWNGTKAHCKRNHEFTPENTGRQNGGHRYCKACKRMTDARRWAAVA